MALLCGKQRTLRVHCNVYIMEQCNYTVIVGMEFQVLRFTIRVAFPENKVLTIYQGKGRNLKNMVPSLWTKC